MPYAPARPEPLCLEPEPQRTTSSATIVSAKKQRVLVLEDDDEFRELLSDFLVTRFFEVTSVRDGAEGLREILKEPFDLIVCDMMMPQVSGEMFYWAVSRVRPAARLRFVFITGYQNDAKVQSFFQRVDATVLNKPFHFEALNTALIDISRKLKG